MTNADRWRNPGGPLRDLTNALGLDPALEFNESPDLLAYSKENFESRTLSADQSQRAQQLATLHRVIKAAVEKYGPSLKVTASVDPVEFELTKQYSGPELEEFSTKLGGAPFDLKIRLNKRELVGAWGFEHPSARFKLFLFAKALERALDVSLQELEGEQALMQDFTGEHKLIILVPDHTIDLNGDYLAVLGGEAVQRWREYLPKRTPDEARDRISFVHDEATVKPRWTGIELTWLTPLQFNVDWRKPNVDARPPASNDPIAARLFSHLLAISLLYVATFSKADPEHDDWTATFKADKYLARVDLAGVATISETLKAANPEDPWTAPTIIGQAVEWIYKENRGITTRLEVLQAVVASSLQDNKPAENLHHLLQDAEVIVERVQTRWDSFMEERLDKYFANVKALEETVEATSKSYSEQVQTLTGTLIQNVLAAVGVVVGSFVASVLSNPFRWQVFLIATGVYVAYLIFFPILIGMITARKRFNDSKNLFEKRRRDFSRRLSETEVNEIIENAVDDRERSYKLWFWITLGIYLGLVVLLTFAIFKVPGLIREWANKFTPTDASYSKPTTLGVVPLTIRGENFDKDKDIVVSVGSSKFSNADGSVKVHGSTVISLSPPRKDLLEATEKNSGLITISQGGAAENVKLPGAPVASADPVPAQWKWFPQREGGVVTASGSNFDSIAAIDLNGINKSFQISNEGKNLELRDIRDMKDLQTGQLTFTLYDGRRIPVLVKFN